MARTKRQSSKYIARAAAFLVALYGTVTFVGCSGSSGSGTTTTPPPPPPPATKTTYQGTIYMATTSGGHIAIVPVTIDPSDATTPIKVELAQIKVMQLSDGTGPINNKTHNFHDVRLDGNTLYYSAIGVDGTATADAGKVHLGSIALNSVNCPTPYCEFTKNDKVLDAEPGSTGMVYCASGQTADYFVPMTMSHPAYIDAIPKSAMLSGAPLASEVVKRTYIGDCADRASCFRAGNTDYIFAHGVNSPDRSKLFVAVNEAETGGVLASRTGVTAYLLDMNHVTAGEVTDASVLASTTISDVPGAVAFRSTYTPDGDKILQAGANRLLVLKADDLSVLDNTTAIGGRFTSVEDHDVMPTPDGKFAILALRFVSAEGQQQESGLQLYDLEKKKAIGDPTRTCYGCHSASSKARMTCGIDGKLTAETK